MASATTPGHVAEAHARLDRLRDRQQQAQQTWLLTHELLSTLPGTAFSSSEQTVGLLVPCDQLLTQLRWQLATRIPQQHAADDLRQREAVAAGRDPARLWQMARVAGSTSEITSALLAAGDVAAEQGWTTAANQAWQQAAALAEQTQQTTVVAELANRQAMLATFAFPNRDFGEASPGSAPAPRAASAILRRVWEEPLGVAAAVPPALALATRSSHSRGPLICWHDSGGVHARHLRDGAVPWGPGPGLPASTRLFPPLGENAATPTWPPAVGRGRLVTAVAFPTRGEASTAVELICLDLTDAAEGRLQWSLPLPAGAVVAPPRIVSNAGDEPLAVFCLHQTTTDLLAVRLLDGQMLWRRPLSLAPTDRAALAREAFGEDTNAVHVAPVLAEDLLLMTSPDGLAWAVDLSGTLIWARQPSHPESPRPGQPLPARFSQPAVCGDVLVLRGPSERELTALDIRSGHQRWTWTAAAPLTLHGSTGDAVLASHTTPPLATHNTPAAGTTTLLSLGGGDGQLRSTREGLPHVRGIPALTPTQLFWPSEAEVHVLSPGTLQSDGVPLKWGRAPRGVPSLTADRQRLVVCTDTSLQVFEPTDSE